jgi:hypothetical protein
MTGLEEDEDSDYMRLNKRVSTIMDWWSTTLVDIEVMMGANTLRHQ